MSSKEKGPKYWQKKCGKEEIYKKRTMTEISEEEMKNSEIVQILLELNDNGILFEGRVRV